MVASTNNVVAPAATKKTESEIDRDRIRGGPNPWGAESVEAEPAGGESVGPNPLFFFFGPLQWLMPVRVGCHMLPRAAYGSLPTPVVHHTLTTRQCTCIGRAGIPRKTAGVGGITVDSSYTPWRQTGPFLGSLTSARGSSPTASMLHHTLHSFFHLRVRPPSLYCHIRVNRAGKSFGLPHNMKTGYDAS